MLKQIDIKSNTYDILVVNKLSFSSKKTARTFLCFVRVQSVSESF